MTGQTNDAPRYEIVKITDLFNVPEDRRELCLVDLGLWLAAVEPLRAMLRAATGCEVAPVRSFIWIDDGKHDGHITVRAKETGETLFSTVIEGLDGKPKQ